MQALELVSVGLLVYCDSVCLLAAVSGLEALAFAVTSCPSRHSGRRL